MSRLVCLHTGEEYELDDPRWRSTSGGLLDLEFTPVIDIAKIQSRPPTLWRYREALPIDQDQHIVSLGEGLTPLVSVPVRDRTVFVKLDHLFPTGSYKDRGATVLVSKIKELGISRVVEDSSGNAGSAIAAYCARAGIQCDVFVPEATSAAKLVQMRTYGAAVHRVPGSREETARTALAAAEKTYYASHSWNPFFFHGTKTFSYEVCEQLGWRAPDVLVVPVGNGTLALGASLGFDELKRAGIIDRVPRIIAVQSAHCSPLFRAFTAHLAVVPRVEAVPTIAEGIAIAEPVRGMQVLDAIWKSRGQVVAVDDEEVKSALREVAGLGYYIEPTAAATIAGLIQYLPRVGTDEVVVTLFSGHGLKDTKTSMTLLGSA